MNIKKNALLMLILAMLVVGCNSNNSENVSGNSDEETSFASEKAISAYDNLDAKKTYQKVIQRMNSRVLYVESNFENIYENYSCYRGIYYTNYRSFGVEKAKYIDKNRFRYTVYTQDKEYTLNGENGPHIMEYKEGKSMHQNMIDTFQSDIYESENKVVKDIIKEVKNEKLLITLYIEEQSEEGINYYVEELIINEKGFIEKRTYTQTNDQYQDINKMKYISTYSNYNKVSTDDFDKELQLLKSCKGLSTDQVMKKIGFIK